MGRTCESLRMDLKEKENSLEKARDDKVVLETQMLALQQDLDSLKLNYELSQSRVKELEDSLDEANDSISRLETSSYHDEHSELESLGMQRCGKRRCFISKVKKEERSLKQKLDDQKNKIKRLEAEKKTMQQESLDCNRENSILQRKLQDCEAINSRSMSKRREN